MRNIPEDNLGYPVLINFKNGGAGSGFQFGCENDNYFITAKHVLFDSDGNLNDHNATLICQTADISDESTFVIKVDLRELEKNGFIYKHLTADVAGFKIASISENQKNGVFEMQPISGIEFRGMGNSPAVVVNSKKVVKLIKDVLVSNDVFLYGYPSSLGLKHSPQFDYNKPLLRKGIVANVNKKHGTIILDCPVYYGNSGGPVVEVELNGGVYKHNVIGIVSQFIPYSEEWQNLSNGILHTEISNSGYSVAVAMDYVFEMLSIDPKLIFDNQTLLNK